MADSTTLYKGLTKPEVGGSTNTWGTKLNADADTIDDNLGRPQPVKAAAAAISAGALALNLLDGLVQSLTISEALTTLTFTNVPAAGVLVRLILEITNGGAFAITWPGSVTHLGGGPPAFKASGKDYVELITVNGGTNWYLGVLSGLPKFTAGYIQTADLADDAVTAAKLADGAIDHTAQIANGVITSAKLTFTPLAITAQAFFSLSGDVNYSDTADHVVAWTAELGDTGGWHVPNSTDIIIPASANQRMQAWVKVKINPIGSDLMKRMILTIKQDGSIIGENEVYVDAAGDGATFSTITPWMPIGSGGTITVTIRAPHWSGIFGGYTLVASDTSLVVTTIGPQ